MHKDDKNVYVFNIFNREGSVIVDAHVDLERPVGVGGTNATEEAMKTDIQAAFEGLEAVAGLPLAQPVSVGNPEPGSIFKHPEKLKHVYFMKKSVLTLYSINSHFDVSTTDSF